MTSSNSFDSSLSSSPMSSPCASSIVHSESDASLDDSISLKTPQSLQGREVTIESKYQNQHICTITSQFQQVQYNSPIPPSSEDLKEMSQALRFKATQVRKDHPGVKWYHVLLCFAFGIGIPMSIAAGKRKKVYEFYAQQAEQEAIHIETKIKGQEPIASRRAPEKPKVDDEPISVHSSPTKMKKKPLTEKQKELLKQKLGNQPTERYRFSAAHEGLSEEILEKCAEVHAKLTFHTQLEIYPLDRVAIAQRLTLGPQASSLKIAIAKIEANRTDLLTSEEKQNINTVCSQGTYASQMKQFFEEYLGYSTEQDS